MRCLSPASSADSEYPYSEDTSLVMLFVVENTLAPSVNIQRLISARQRPQLCSSSPGTECGFFNFQVHVSLTVDVLRVRVPVELPLGRLPFLGAFPRGDAAGKSELNLPGFALGP